MSVFRNKNNRIYIAHFVFYAIYPVFLTVITEISSLGSVNNFLLYTNNALHKTGNILFALALTAALFYALCALIKHTGVSAIITALPLMTFAFVNYHKLITRGEPFVASDFVLAGSIGSIAKFAGKLVNPVSFYVCVALLIVYIVILFILCKPFVRKRCKPISQCIFAITLYVLPIFCIFTILQPVDRSASLNNLYNKGFIASFFGDMAGIDPPLIAKPIVDGTTELYGYDQQGNTLSPDEMPDIIVILSESFWDPVNIPGVEISPDPTANFKALGAEGITFDMVSPVFGGNTVVAELEVLSGLNLEGLPLSPYQTYVKGEVPTLASYLKEHFGYSTIGVHTFDKTFFGRDKIYGMLGFDKFIGKEDFPEDAQRVSDEEYLTDIEFVDRLIQELEESENPTFIFGISMENHGLYYDKYQQHDIQINAPGLNSEQMNKVKNLAQGVYLADMQLIRLVEHLRQRERNAVLLFFGDHLPSMGPGYDVFTDSGYVEDVEQLWTNNEWVKMHTTPALIWSNYKNKAGFAGTFSPYFASTLLVNYVGFSRDAFFNFMSNYMEILPVKNGKLAISKQGEILVNNLTQAEQNYADQHKYHTHTILFNNE